MNNGVRSKPVCSVSYQTALLSLALSALVLAPAVLLAPARGVSAQAPRCTVLPNKIASPAVVDLGQEVTIRLTLEASCPSSADPAEVVLAIDRSASMSEGDRFPATIAAAEAFARLVDFGPLRVSVLTFSDTLNLFGPQATVHLPLSDDRNAVLATLAGLSPPPVDTLWTNLTAAIDSGREVLNGPDARPGTRRVLIMLTDGDHNALPIIVGPPEDAADAARAAGITIFTIGLGVSDAAASRLTAIAGAPERFFRAPTSTDLESVYRAVARALQSSGLGDVVVVDLVPPDVELVAGSVNPPPSESAPGRLVWRVPRVSVSSGWSAAYRVRPLVVGTYPTNISAVADYVDADGFAGRVEFPVPVITVRGLVANAVYLPIVMAGYCRPDNPFDVVLAIDNSSSMDGEKALRARTAASQFLSILSMPPTQAGVLAFHNDAELVQRLTTDRRLAQSALIGLPGGTGTRIDRALDKALEELSGPRRLAGNVPVVVLLTDGRQTGAPESKALDAAATARAAGLTIYTIGIGADVSADLLTQIAGDPARYYAAAGPEELLSVYVSIAGSLPCSMP